MHTNTGDPVDRRAAEQSMTIEVRGGIPTDDRLILGIVNIGQIIGATHVIIEVGAAG